MKPKFRDLKQVYLLRPRVTDMIDMRYELVNLAALIDWEAFGIELAGSSASIPGTRLYCWG